VAEEELTERIDHVARELHRLEMKVDAQFAKVDQEFAKIDERFAKVDERFAKVDDQFRTWREHWSARSQDDAALR
jgi:predicted  nucleic acid-binding Zn-ribbon protein